MDPLLDETSLVPCPEWPPGRRILLLASVLQALDRLGLPRVLRSVRNAAGRDIGSGRGLNSWCFDRTSDLDAGRLVASRLSKQPFIDGDDGLIAAAEGGRAIEATVNGQAVYALALAALGDEPAVSLGRAERSRGEQIVVNISWLDDEGVTTQASPALCLITPQDVGAARTSIELGLDRSIVDGATIIRRAVELFPYLRFGTRAEGQLRELTGAEAVFRQLLRHLRALNLGAKNWDDGPFAPGDAIAWSDESNQTLEHRRYGPMRDFPTPAGFQPQRWRFHTKMTGGAGFRLYFRGERTEVGPIILVGYFGPHLPTVKYPT